MSRDRDIRLWYHGHERGYTAHPERLSALCTDGRTAVNVCRRRRAFPSSVMWGMAPNMTKGASIPICAVIVLTR